jgi:hypothetical protein
MALKTCPFCAEEIQEAAMLCKHCGQSLTGQPTASRNTQTARAADDILAVYNGAIMGNPGRFALICMADRIIIRRIIGAAAMLLLTIPALIIKQSRFKAIQQSRTIHDLPTAKNDQIIAFTPGGNVTLIKGKGLQKLPQLQIRTTNGLTKYFVEDSSAYEKLRTLYPTMPTEG